MFSRTYLEQKLMISITEDNLLLNPADNGEHCCSSGLY